MLPRDPLVLFLNSGLLRLGFDSGMRRHHSHISHGQIQRLLRSSDVPGHTFWDCWHAGAAWRSGNKFAYLPQSVNPDCNRQVESGRKVQTKDVFFLCMMHSDVMGCLESWGLTSHEKRLERHTWIYLVYLVLIATKRYISPLNLVAYGSLQGSFHVQSFHVVETWVPWFGARRGFRGFPGFVRRRASRPSNRPLPSF